MNTRLITKTLATALILAASSANAAVVVFDAVPTSATNPFVSASLGSGVTVTGSDVFTDLPSSGTVDPTASPWNGNQWIYRNNSATPGSVTYAAATGDYFTDFGAQIIVNTGAIGGNVADALPRFTFESSTDGLVFSTFAVTGTEDTTSGNADWTRVNVSTTALDALTDITHLRVTMTQKASGGAGWHQVLGSVSMDVVVVPEPSSAALLGLVGLALILRRRRA